MVQQEDRVEPRRSRLNPPRVQRRTWLLGSPVCAATGVTIWNPMKPDPAHAIQRQRGMPLHHQLFLVMRNAIQTGRFVAGQALPSEERLASSYGVSRVTVRNAMASLQASGLVVRRQGKGTFVQSGAIDSALHARNADLLTHIKLVADTTTVTLLELDEVTIPAHLQGFFECGADARFQRAVRLRSVGSRPVFHVCTYLPIAIGKRLSRRQMSSTSLYQLLRGLGIELASGHQIVSATLADPAAARHLGCFVGAALLSLKRFHYDQNGRPVEYIEVLASPENFEVHMRLEADDIR